MLPRTLTVVTDSLTEIATMYLQMCKWIEQEENQNKEEKESKKKQNSSTTNTEFHGKQVDLQIRGGEICL